MASPKSHVAAEGPTVALGSGARCEGCPIRARAVCAYCSTSELDLLDRIKTYRTYRPGEEILYAGDEAPVVGSVVTGVVKLTRTLIDGRRQMVGLLFPSDFVGRTATRRSECDAVAATEVTLCLFQRRPFETLLADIPSLRERLLEMTMDELDATREWLLLLGRKTAREKVSSFLALLARRSAETGAAESVRKVRIPLTREDMADYLGLTIETVSRQMSALKRDGVIAFSDARGIEILDFEELLDASGDDADGGVAG